MHNKLCDVPLPVIGIIKAGVKSVKNGGKHWQFVECAKGGSAKKNESLKLQAKQGKCFICAQRQNFTKIYFIKLLGCCSTLA